MNVSQSIQQGIKVLALLVVVMLATTATALAAEMVNNGNFNGSTGWTFSTTTYDSTNTNTADGSGSGTISASGRNTQATDTITQAVTIGAGSSISSAADVVAYVKHSSTAVATASRSIKIELRYVDTSTVEIFYNNTFADATPWTSVANNTATAFPLNLAQDVDQIIVTLDTKDGNNASAASQLWADDISIAYTAAASPDTLSVAANTPVASSAAPGDLDVQMQYLQVDSDNQDDGQVEITSVTVDDLGTAAAGDIDNLKVHIDSNNNFGDGVLGSAAVATWDGTSTAVDMTGIAVADRTVTAGTSKYIWITYDINSATVDGTTIQSSVTNISVNAENGASGTWNSNSITVAAGASNTLTSCADCHDYPPADGSARNNPEGAVIGDHTPHNGYTCNFCHVIPASETSSDFNHRDGDINMKNATIGDSGTGDDGSYSKGATFAQSNSPTTGTCSNVNCHSNAVTPQWGVGTTACDSCHGAPPATGAHSAHYAGKGWTDPDTAGTNCVACHPDNTTTHSDVTDGVITVNAGLTYNSVSGSCSSPGGLGCHNDYATPDWSVGTVTCASCHTAGGLNAADPVSGLHDETPTVSAVIHNPSDVNFTGCEDCHTANPSATHVDGTLDAPSTFAAGVGFDGVPTPSKCTASTCHSDGGAWSRKWHENSDLADGSECAGCHGTFATEFVTGMSLRHQTTASGDTDGDIAAKHDGTDKCYTCHNYKAGDTTYYDFTTQHRDGSIQINSETGFVDNGTTVGCGGCHASADGTADEGHEFTDTTATNGWVRSLEAGPAGGCDSCHGGSGQYYPNGTAYPNRAGRHDKHMSEIATVLGYTLPGTDAEQKHMCEYCHNDANGVGGSGHTTDSGDSIADVGGFNPIWDTANPPATADDATFNTTDQTCATADCHNNKTTTAGTYGWRDAGLASCTMCHTAGGTGIADPTSALHDETPTVSGVIHNPSNANFTGCEDCHTTSPSTTHRDGVADTPSTFDAGIGYAAGTPPTCTASTCHSDGGAWNRLWHESSNLTDGTECAGCHGTFATGFVSGMSLRHQTSTDGGDTGGEIEANHDGTDKCVTCHAYDGADTYGHKWATHHMDNSIEISDQAGFVDNGTTVGCGACHASADGTADGGHEFTDTTATNGWTRTTVAGPTASCTSCHSAAGTGAAGVGPDSPHSNDTAAGGGVYTCEGCHTSHSGGVVVIPNNADVGINYTGNGETGINLGGSQTTGATEAEICWNCHDTHAVSEWGINTGGTYDYGSVDVSNWSTATWTSANFTYKDGSLTAPPGAQARSSMHDTLSSPWPAATTDSVSDVSCTYCHDVHDTNTAPGDASSGKPHLRGSWNPSPYPEDGAPRSGDTYTAGASPYGAVPRGNTGTTGPGAYQIDQNNADPNAGMGTYAATDGLCQLCHDEATLTTNAPLHSNPVGYFTNDTSAARNIFQQSDRQAALTRYDPGMAYQNTDLATAADPGKGWMGGLRNSDFDTAIAVPPTIGGRYGYDAPTFEWGVTMDDATVDVDFHNFSCSKCHTPHASRLPRLMITNCLDTSVNTWDDQFNTHANWSNWPGVTPGDNHELAEAHTAQNCHRDTGEASGPGWNTVTPW